ncbi:hypothetical protein LOTGIDRAFT_234293 [Lottia gigantea]|uniref:Major facilitator superfamily (MFS) profile domain-containing protein n=1 Tax=Lottia gigantea TaxID=225164 RepID=V4A3E3_LOTGI|nr:hypothetical protein LOTGIDRAFT_234293 [Lottia gigantea]ESO89445.1 hypothetical protein LOTGIDRAFT_234293 [Lottia gigantea]
MVKSYKLNGTGAKTKVSTIECKDDRTESKVEREEKGPDEERKETGMALNLVEKIVLFLTASCSYFIVIGVAFSMTTFLPYWLDEFKSSRAQTAMIQSVLVGIHEGLNTLTGIIIVKVGARITILSGALLSTIGFIGAYFAPSTPVLLVTLGIIGGTGCSCIYLVSLVTVSSSFGKSSSLAICLFFSFASVGVSVFPYLNEFLISKYSWRGTMLIYGGIFFQTFAFGYLMTSLSRRGTKPACKDPDAKHWSTVQKLKHIFQLGFILTAISTCIALFAGNGFLVILSDVVKDITDDNGALFLLEISLTVSVSTACFGFLNKIPFFKSYVLFSTAVLVLGTGLILLSLFKVYYQTVILVVFFAIGLGGTVVMNNVAVLDLVDPETFPIAVGIINTAKGICTGIAGIIYGLLYDITLSYSLPLRLIGSIACVASSLPILGRVITTKCLKSDKKSDPEIRTTTEKILE